MDCNINCSSYAWDLQRARLCSKGFYYRALRCASALQVGMRNCWQKNWGGSGKPFINKMKRGCEVFASLSLCVRVCVWGCVVPLELDNQKYRKSSVPKHPPFKKKQKNTHTQKHTNTQLHTDISFFPPSAFPHCVKHFKHGSWAFLIQSSIKYLRGKPDKANMLC